GPLEPGDSTVTNGDMGRYSNSGGTYFGTTDGATPVMSDHGVVAGQVMTSQGTFRSGLMVHPQGSSSDGCITTSKKFANAVESAVISNGGSMELRIVDAGDCPCN